jgi:type I restriction enzyme S subunit
MTLRIRHLAHVNPSTPAFDTLPPTAELTFMPLETVWADDRLDTGRVAIKADVSSGYVRFQDGDVLVPKTAPTFQHARATVVDRLTNGVGAGSSELHLLRAKPRTDARFLAYVTRSSPFVAQGMAAYQGVAGLQRVPADFVADWPVAALTDADQRRIANFLDDQVARLDRAITIRKGQSRLMTQRSLRSLRDAVESRNSSSPSGIPWLPSIDRDWRVSRLKYHTACLDSRRIPLSAEQRATRKGPYPYYGASTIVDHLEGYLFDEELVLVGEDGASLENPNFDVVQRVSRPCWVNNHAHVLRAGPTLIPDYLAEYIRGADRWFMISGATRPKITQEDLMSLPIVVPPLSTQRELVQRMKRVAAQQEQVRALSRQHEVLLNERKQALITEAVTGQFDVTTARAVA